MMPWSTASETSTPAAASLSLSANRSARLATVNETWSKPSGSRVGAPWGLRSIGLAPGYSKNATWALPHWKK